MEGTGPLLEATVERTQYRGIALPLLQIAFCLTACLLPQGSAVSFSI